MIGKVKVTSVDLGPSLRIAYRVYVDDRHTGTMGQTHYGEWAVSRCNRLAFGRILSRRFDTRQEALGFLLDEHFFNTVTEHDE